MAFAELATGGTVSYTSSPGIPFNPGSWADVQVMLQCGWPVTHYVRWLLRCTGFGLTPPRYEIQTTIWGPAWNNVVTTFGVATENVTLRMEEVGADLRLSVTGASAQQHDFPGTTLAAFCAPTFPYHIPTLWAWYHDDGFGNWVRGRAQLHPVQIYQPDCPHQWIYPWNGVGDLADWTCGGVGYSVGGGVIDVWPAVPNTTENWWGGRGCLSCPAFHKVAALEALPHVPQWLYYVDGLTLIERLGEAGPITPVHDATHPGPWIGPDSARYVVCEEWDNDVVYLRYTSSWGAPVLIRASRYKPCAMRLEPSSDVIVGYIDGSDNLIVCILSWNGAGYDVGGEIDTGFNANGTGDFYMLPDGHIALVYQDTADNIQVIESDLSGGTWA